MSVAATDAERYASRPRVTPLLSVLMVSHNSGPLLHEAINSVLKQPLVDSATLELVLVDNASSAKALDKLLADPRLRLALNPDNRGFGVACNQAARLARGHWLLLLNPDCQLPEGAVNALLDVAEREQVGLLGARLLNRDGSLQTASYRRDPRPWRALMQALGLGKSPPWPAAPIPAFLRERGKEQEAAELTEVEAISGALMLIRAEDFQRLGGFDEGYRLHVEDLDLCRRARESGLRVAVASGIEVTHVKGESSNARPIWVEWQKHRGMWRYFRKHDAASTPSLLWPVFWLGLWTHFAIRAPLAWWRSG